MRPPGASWRLRPTQQRLDVDARCGRADRRSTASQVPARRAPAAAPAAVDVADLERDVRVARARARSIVSGR